MPHQSHKNSVAALTSNMENYQLTLLFLSFSLLIYEVTLSRNDAKYVN